jgi:hypothetical protein
MLLHHVRANAQSIGDFAVVITISTLKNNGGSFGLGQLTKDAPKRRSKPWIAVVEGASANGAAKLISPFTLTLPAQILLLTENSQPIAGYGLDISGLILNSVAVETEDGQEDILREIVCVVRADSECKVTVNPLSVLLHHSVQVANSPSGRARFAQVPR